MLFIDRAECWRIGMKIRFLLCFGLIQSMLLWYNVGAYGEEAKKKCAPGCFCVFDGMIPDGYSMENICGHGTSQRLSCADTNTKFNFVGGVGDELVLSCTRNNVSGVTYYFDEFSDIYTGTTGMYGFLGEDLIVMPTTDIAGGTFGGVGVFQCPSTHPSSAAGAKTPYECYTHDANGNKVYFTTTASSDVKVLAANLQNLLNKATQIAKDLQRLTKDNNQTDNVNTNKFDNTKEIKKKIVEGAIRKSTAVNKKLQVKTITNKSAIVH